MERRIASAKLKASLEEFLVLTTMTLSTVGKDQEPHAAAIYFAADASINLYFFSETGSQHALDIGREPRAAVAIQAEAADWQDIRGLQMRGKVRVVEIGQEWQAAWQLYHKKFPFVSDLEDLVAANQMYSFEPTWIRLVDNRRGFGFKQEWEVVATEKAIGIPPIWRVTRMTNG